MRKITNILFALIFTVSATACNSTQNNENLTKDDKTTKVKKVEVYYFHGTRRCATCIAVGITICIAFCIAVLTSVLIPPSLICIRSGNP